MGVRDGGERASRCGRVFDPDAKRGKVEIVCEMKRGEEGCKKRILSVGHFFSFFFCFFIMCYLFLGTKSLMQRELCREKNL